MTIAVIALIACTSDSPTDPQGTAPTMPSGSGPGTTPPGSWPPTDTTSSPAPVDPDELYGTVPPSPVDAPDFSVQNRDETLRSREDLLGHPTVMWFYPKAGTTG